MTIEIAVRAAVLLCSVPAMFGVLLIWFALDGRSRSIRSSIVLPDLPLELDFGVDDAFWRWDALDVA